ncbi:MAG: hypothetical protein ACRDHS_01585 [Actinomycetota bacterium]
MASIERAVGSAFDDWLLGSSVRNHLNGGSGADRLFGPGPIRAGEAPDETTWPDA